MKQILFVNACMRGPEQSRTWRLSQAFLAACRSRWPEAAVKERELTGCELPVLTGALAQERDRRAEADIGGPMFEPAREMAQADLVVIAAGGRADDALFLEAQRRRAAEALYNIGDSFQVGKVFEAVRAAYALGLSL